MRLAHPVVSTAGGELRGRRVAELDVDVFLGIPYAASPSGSRRWAPPAAAERWTGVRDATDPGPVCPQPARPFSEWAHGPLPATAEDSLRLHVWTPAERASADGRPVLVFLHGGGWALGWGSNPLLHGHHLARALDAVVVTVNYRLGSLGWLRDPAPAPDGAAANWGLLDQLAALRWVAAHAAAFGGDPARVTLAGESAGAGSVLHLLTREDAGVLFARALALSPPLHELVVDGGLAERWTATLAAQLGVEAPAEEMLERMRSLPPEAIVAAHEELLAGPFRGSRGGAMPIVEPATLPADPATVPGAHSEIPLLIGSNADEATFFFRAGGRRIDPEPAQLETMIARLTHTDAPAAAIAAAAERLEAAGRPATPNDILCAVVTEAWFGDPVNRYAAARAAAGGQVHRYRIEQPAAEDDLGAVHSLSVPLLFGTWRDGGVARRLAGADPAVAAVTAALHADVRRFVHGEPVGWAPVTAQATAVAVYGGPDGPRVIRAPATAAPTA